MDPNLIARIQSSPVWLQAQKHISQNAFLYSSYMHYLSLGDRLFNTLNVEERNRISSIIETCKQQGG